MPRFRQLFVAGAARPRRRASRSTGMAFCLRKRAEREAGVLLPVAVGAHPRLQGHAHHRRSSSRSSRTCPTARFATELALVHSRFSTNTFPSLAAGAPVPADRAQRRDQHRQGQPQLDARRARAMLASDVIPGDLDRLFPICTPGASDSASLRRGARAAAPRRPLAAARRADDDPGGVGEPRRDGPGPARVLRVPLHAHGALGRPGLRHLHRRHADRRGARPQRPAPGALLGDRRRPRRAGQRGRRARHRPGDGRRARAGCSRAGCSSSTPTHGRIVDDEEIKAELAGRAPVRRVAARRPDPPRGPARARARRAHRTPRCTRRQQTFGYTEEELRILLTPDGRAPAPSRSARWAPTPRSRCCRSRPRLLFDYFTQLFAQVTNPPLDAIREELVTVARRRHRAGANLLDGRPRRTAASSCCRSR